MLTILYLLYTFTMALGDIIIMLQSIIPIMHIDYLGLSRVCC